MRARQMIFEGGFSPEDVTALTDVLETVWAETMEGQLLNGLDRASERERMAAIIIALGRHRASESPEEFRRRVKTAFLGRCQFSSDAAE